MGERAELLIPSRSDGFVPATPAAHTGPHATFADRAPGIIDGLATGDAATAENAARGHLLTRVKEFSLPVRAWRHLTEPVSGAW